MTVMAKHPDRVKTGALAAGDLIRVDLRSTDGQVRPSHATLVKIISITRRPSPEFRPGRPYVLVLQLGDGERVVMYSASHCTQMVGQPRWAVDADCPECHWPERWYDPVLILFGCNRCDYTSQPRER